MRQRRTLMLCVYQLLHDLASCLEKLEGFNISAGKVRDAANSSAATWRKLERDNRVALKQKKKSRQAGLFPFLHKKNKDQ